MVENLNWSAIRGMTEKQAEDYLSEHGGIPDEWLDPLFRQNITGRPADIEANLDLFELSYQERLGGRTRAIGWQRNIAGQGHPEERRP